MLYIGIFFIVIGLYLVIEDVIDIKYFIKEREIKKSLDFKIDEDYEFKASVGLFSVTIGILALINYLYY